MTSTSIQFSNNIYQTPAIIPSNQTFQQESNTDIVSELVKKVAKRSLIELAVSLSFTGITILFVPAFIGTGSLVAFTLAVVALNTFLRMGCAAIEYKVHQLKNIQTPEARLFSHRLTFLGKIISWIAPYNFSLLDETTRNVLVHEAGHAMAASSVYKNARPRIEVYPFKGGATSFCPKELTKFGKYLGWKNADLLVSGAGAGISMIAALASIIAAHKMDKNSEVRKYLIMTAISTIVQHIFYAFTALWTSPENLGHDFIALWRHNIHPLAAVATMIALPLITFGGLYFLDQLKEKATQSITPGLSVPV